MQSQTVNFDNLIGSTATLYSCTELNRFQLGQVIFEVIEDEQDGYRSSMSEVQIINRNADRRNPLAEVTIVSTSGDIRGYELVDKQDDHMWLRFGTSDYDNYYPCFLFQTYPKPPIEESLKELIK